MTLKLTISLDIVHQIHIAPESRAFHYARWQIKERRDTILSKVHSAVMHRLQLFMHFNKNI